VKSGKVQARPRNQPFLQLPRKRVEFPSQQESDVLEMIKRRVFWLGGEGPVDIADPYDCQYANLSRERMIVLAGRLADEGVIKLEGDKSHSHGSAAPGRTVHPRHDAKRCGGRTGRNENQRVRAKILNFKF